MPDYAIADHHFDPLHDRWVLVLGIVEEVEETIVEQVHDDHGEPVFEPGETIEGVDGEEIVLPGAPVMREETRTARVIVPVEDFAFTALDPRWEGMSDEAIVKEQRKMVRAALRKREKDAQDAAARLQPLPGVGDPL